MKTLATEKCRVELVQRLKEVRPDSPRRWGRMTAHQMVCHLSDCCRMATGDRRVSTSSGILPRTLIKWLALYAPLQWRAGLVTRPEVDQEATGTRPVRFDRDVAELEQLLNTLTTRGRRAGWPDHPVFGRMSEGDWLRWAYLHTDLHLRQFGL